jgi:hypothetical protein
LAQRLTYREVADLFKHYVADRSGHQSASSPWSAYSLIRMLLLSRSGLLQTLISSGEKVGYQTYQTLSCVKLKEENQTSCPFVIPPGCSWLKTIEPIPKFIKTISVTTIDGQTNIPLVDWNTYKYKNKFSRVPSTKKPLYYTIREEDGENYFYVMGSEFLKMITFTAIFEDPYCALIFPKCETSQKDVEVRCNPWDTPFILDQSWIDKVLLSTWQMLPPLKNQTVPDLIGDTVDNTKGDINPKI